MLEDLFADVTALTIGEPDVMMGARPIDAGVPSLLIVHGFSPFETASHRDPDLSLYGRSSRQSVAGAVLLLGLDRGQSVGAHVPSW